MVRAQSLILVSLLSSELIASPVSTRNTATYAGGEEDELGSPLPHSHAFFPDPVFLSSPPEIPFFICLLFAHLPLSPSSSPAPFCPFFSYLLPFFPQQEGVAPHPDAPGEAIGTPPESLQETLSCSGPAALTGLLQGEKGASVGPFHVPRV